MYFLHKNKNGGFVALMSAILVSAVLLALLMASNLSSFYARADTQDAQSESASLALASGCADAALLRLAQNYQYDPQGDAVKIAADTCDIESITPHAPRAGTSTQVTVETQASAQESFSNVEVTAVVLNPSVSPSVVPLPPNVDVLLWREVP